MNNKKIKQSHERDENAKGSQLAPKTSVVKVKSQDIQYIRNDNKRHKG